MRRPIRNTLFLLLLSLSCSTIVAQQKSSAFGWDLSYQTLLERNNVGKDELIRLWLGMIRSPAGKWINDWNGKRIVSSILIEYPAFHAAERQTLWLVRTVDDAHYWESTHPLRTPEKSEEPQIEEPVATTLYDSIYKEASTWQQLPPKPAEDLPEQVFPRYMGFISLYGLDGSRQMLLTFEDFFTCPAKTCAPGKGKLGRLMTALKPIYRSEASENYKHKTEAEIARMTPEQRIDDQMLEDDEHLFREDGKQSDLIRKYRRMDGLKGAPHLIQLMDTYQPKRARDTRFSRTLMMAEEIDERVVRLRASPEGRKMIEAIERLAVRMGAEGKKDTLVEITLKSVKGLNFADEAIIHQSSDRTRPHLPKLERAYDDR